MPNAKHREPIVPKKVKAALEILFTDPKNDLIAAATAAGMKPHKLREQMKLPHVEPTP
jgi:hypothetical protein